jgi:hypothetical protein
METHTVKVQCHCAICAINAVKLGKDMPLAALITPTLAATLCRDIHGIVHLAHDPVLGPRQSAAIGI